MTDDVELTDERIIEFMLQCMHNIREYTKGGRVQFFADQKTQDATIRALYMVTDVSKRLSPGAKDAMDHVPWGDIAGFRNYLVHEYLGDLDLEIVWKSIEDELPPLEKAVAHYIKNKKES